MAEVRQEETKTTTTMAENQSQSPEIVQRTVDDPKEQTNQSNEEQEEEEEERQTIPNDDNKEQTVTTQNINNNNNNNNDDDNPFDEDFTPRVILAKKSNAFYLKRACRLLRIYDEITLIGGGNDMSRACLIVELLKKQEIANIKKIETKMAYSSSVTSNGKVIFGRPRPIIEFQLTRGNLGEFISGFVQRKIIELFEKFAFDENNLQSHKAIVNELKETCELSEELVRSLELEKAFYSNKESIAESDRFLQISSQNNNGFIGCSVFIRYASKLIDPKLKDLKFRLALRDHYQIKVRGVKPRNDNINPNQQEQQNTQDNANNDNNDNQNTTDDVE